MKGRLLITGGFGYLGGRIGIGLADRGCRVVLGSRRHIPPPLWLPGAETVAMDVMDPDSLLEATREVQVVVHLAALNEIQCAQNPLAAIQVNTLGSFHMLDAAIRNGVEQFIYFSTAHVYRAPLVGRIDEDSITRPTHPYAITHRAAEDYVVAAHDKGEISALVVRLSNGFGAPTHPGVDRWSLLVNDLCRQAVETRQLALKSSGLQHRDFVPLADVVEATGFLVEHPVSQSNDCIFNLGSGQSLSVLEMARRIADRCEICLGFRPELIHPEPQVHELEIAVDFRIAKLQKLGFAGTGTDRFAAEIDRMLKFCKQAFGD